MNIFSGKRYFNDILWAYNNNTLSDTGISSNKILKYKEHNYGKVKEKSCSQCRTIRTSTHDPEQNQDLNRVKS